MTDFHLQPEGTISILYPLNDAAKQWAADNINPGAQKWAGGIVIEHRFVDDILSGIARDKLKMEVI